MTWPRGTDPNGPYRPGPCPKCGQPAGYDVLQQRRGEGSTAARVVLELSRRWEPCGDVVAA